MASFVVRDSMIHKQYNDIRSNGKQRKYKMNTAGKKCGK